DQERTNPAHRVGQCPAGGGDARPAGTDQNGGGKVFLERRCALLQAVAALVQAVPGQVQREDCLSLVQPQVHTNVRAELVHRGTLASGGAQTVDNRVLDLQGTEMGVVDAGATAAEFNGQAAGRR